MGTLPCGSGHSSEVLCGCIAHFLYLSFPAAQDSREQSAVLLQAGPRPQCHSCCGLPGQSHVLVWHRQPSARQENGDSCLHPQAQSTGSVGVQGIARLHHCFPAQCLAFAKDSSFLQKLLKEITAMVDSFKGRA